MLPLEHSAILLTCIKRESVLKANFFVFLRVAVLDRFYCRLNIVLEPTLSRYIHSDLSVSTLITQIFYGKMILSDNSKSMLHHKL